MWSDLHTAPRIFHLLLAPLFPWLMHDFGLTFTEVGALMSIFFVISGIGQASAGFAVSQVGPGGCSCSALRCCP